MLWSRRLVRSFHIDLILLLLFCQSAILPKNLWNGIQHQIRAPRDLSFLSLLLISHLFILWFVIFRFLPRNLNFQWRWTMARRTTLPHSFDFHFFFIFAVVEWIFYSSVIHGNKSASHKGIPLFKWEALKIRLQLHLYFVFTFEAKQSHRRLHDFNSSTRTKGLTQNQGQGQHLIPTPFWKRIRTTNNNFCKWNGSLNGADEPFSVFLIFLHSFHKNEIQLNFENKH